jgi:hypothetical protein
MDKNPSVFEEEIQTSELFSIPAPLLSPVDQSSRKYIYYFDIPPLFSSGSVNVYDHKLVATFPEPASEQSSLDHKYIPYVSLFVDKKQLFSYDWLPIYSVLDLEKCQDMFYKLYFEYSSLRVHYDVHSSALSGIFNLIETSKETSEFTLSARETYNSASIEIELTKNEKMSLDCLLPIHIQIYIGAFLVFCSQRDLQPLNSKNLDYLLNFILLRFLKCYSITY